MPAPTAPQSPGRQSPPRVAYLVSQYPKLSHAFIEREIRALRELGADVRTFSVRPTAASELLSQRDRDEAATTSVLLESPPRLLMAQAPLLARDARAWGRSLLRALRTGAPTLRSRVWQAFYALEAGVLVQRMHDSGLRHVHVHLANNGADVARLAVPLGREAYGGEWSWSLAMHGPTEFSDITGYDLAAKVRAASFVACITDYCRSQLMAIVEPSHWAKLGLVRMSVDADRFAVDARESSGGRPLRVLFVGRLVPEKGPQVLLDAVAALPHSSVAVRVVGDGPLREQLQQAVAAAGLADRVELVGPMGQESLPEQYAWADVFCLPSFAEGLPVVLMEALAAGCTVVTTAIAGIPELVEHDVTGLLVTPGRADALAAALLRVRGDDGLRARLTAAGAERVRAAYSPQGNARALLHLLPRS